MPSIFTRIVNGEIPAHTVAEDDHFLAFLDINPLAEGHTLVIPKKEVDYLFDLDDETYDGLWQFAKRLAGPLKRAVPCRRVCVVVIGDEVPHAHVHLIPMNRLSEVSFTSPKLKMSQDQLAAVAARIKKEMNLDLEDSEG